MPNCALIEHFSTFFSVSFFPNQLQLFNKIKRQWRNHGNFYVRQSKLVGINIKLAPPPPMTDIGYG